MKDYARIIRRRAWSIAFVTIAIFLIVLIYSRSLPPIYRTSSSIEVTKAIASEGMERWLYYKGHPIETAMKQIVSPACIEAALREMKILNEQSPENEVRARVTETLGMISTSAVPNTNMISVAATGPDRDILDDYVNTICQVYKRLDKDWDRKADDEVIEFLEERIEIYRVRLEKAERSMIEFKSQNLSRGFGADIAAQMKMRSDLTIEAARLSNEIEEIRQRSEAMWMQDYPQLAVLMSQKAELESRRASILQQYTANHPSLSSIEENLGRITAQVEEYRRTFEADRRERVEKAVRVREQNLASIRQKIAELEASMATMPQDQVVFSNLEMELNLARNLYKMFWERLEQQKIVRQSKSGGVNLSGPAPPAVKIYPNERAHQTVGLALGLLVGFAFAFLLETMDTSIRTIEEIEEFVGLPVLGVAPLIVLESVPKKDEERGPGAPDPSSPGSVLYFHPRDPASEAYRALASTLEFTFFNEGHRVLLIASATPQEGKTTSVANVGIALALSGRKTMILDCNLRHPGTSKIFSLSGHAGLSEVLSGFTPWRVSTYPTLVENLDIIPTGSLPGQPVELIKNGLPALLRELSTVYAAVIIDSPPILPVADASIISSMAGGTLLVYSQGRAPRDVLIRAKTKIETARGRVLGTFLNKVRPEGELGRNYYYYYYSYYPGRNSKGEKPQSA